MSKALATKNVAAIALAFALIVGFAFSFATPAKADTLSDLQAQVQALLAQIAALQGGSSSTTPSAACHTFTRNHKAGESGGEVMWVQQFLNSMSDTRVSVSGAGSPGNETSYFGPATKAAVIKFQNKYAADILAPVGLTSGTGNWGPSTRAKANLLCAGSGGTTTGGGTTVPTGPGITVSAAAQPANSLAPGGTSRVPFTSFTLTNNTGGAVTINGISVQRTGLAADAVFTGVVLVDSNGLQMGVSRTFDSNHNTTVGDTFTLPAGASQTFTVAGNMQTAAVLGGTPSYAGQVASIAVTGVNTSVPVNGSLPITGAQQTINASLTVGTVTASVSSFDPNAARTKNIGDTAIIFSGARFTAGSAEDVKFYSIRWRMNGSVSPSDLGNIMTVVNGTSYPTVLSSDGRYLTSTFPGGILITKGNAVDAYVKGDLTGVNSASRIAELDIDKTSDVYFVGQTYGYGIAPTLSNTGTFSTASTHATTIDSTKQPWFQGSTVSINAGTVTTISNSPTVASQNIAVNVSNQVLGGFDANFAGEPVTVQGMIFRLSSTGTTSVSELTSVSLVDQNGAVVAGPVDASGSTVTFSNSVTFPVGLRTFTLKGKIPSTGWPTGATVQANTTPSSWTSPQGQNSGNSITISTANFTMNTMTVRAATTSVAASPSPSSQTVVAGGQKILLANIQLDGSQSGEDVRYSSFQVFESGTGGVGSLNTCQLWNGTTALNTGSNVLNTVVAGQNTVTLDNAITVPKGSVLTLGFTCNLSASATAGLTYIFGVSAVGFTVTGTGSVSGNTVTPAITTTNSGTMTVSAAGALAVTIDSSSPSYAVQAGGTTGVTLGVIKLRATNEALSLTKLGLTNSNGTYGSASTGAGNAASGAGDLVQVYLYSGSTLLGTASFIGTNSQATSSLSTPLNIPRDVDTTITIKGDLAGIGVSAPGGIGNLIMIDPLNYEATGVSSGTTVRGGATAGVAGVRLFKSYPTLSIDTLPSTGVADGRLMRFKVTANAAGSVGVSQFTFSIATSTVTSVTNVQLFGFTDSSYSQAISGQGVGGQIGGTVTATSTSNFTMAPTTANPVQVSAGQTAYFELRGTVAGVTTGSSVIATLKGDASYITPSTSGYNVATSSMATSTSNFVWAGNSTTTSLTTGQNADFSNGYSLPGLPSSGLIQARSN